MVLCDKTNYPQWQYAFQRVGADQAQVVIYFAKMDSGCGVEEVELVRRLSTILQGRNTTPLNSEAGWLYFVYAPEAVAVELRESVQ